MGIYLINWPIIKLMGHYLFNEKLMASTYTNIVIDQLKTNLPVRISQYISRPIKNLWAITFTQ